ncbi:MAG: FlgD immunoglobulin-like domain containing protein, partial [Rhodothermales bacterium]
SSSATVDFLLSSVDDLVLRNVFNYPNPTSGHTRFIFEHNQPTGTSADIQVRIYTLAGRPVRTIDGDEALPAGILTAGPVQVLWDGRDEDLNPLASGIYLYKVRVAVDGLDGERHVSEQIEKLAIIH